MLRERVKKGMEFLDINVPDWRSRIDLERLDMQSCDDCILGQLFGDYWESPWPKDLQHLYRPWGYDDSADHGFAAGATDYDELTEMWKKELR